MPNLFPITEHGASALVREALGPRVPFALTGSVVFSVNAAMDIDFIVPKAHWDQRKLGLPWREGAYKEESYKLDLKGFTLNAIVLNEEDYRRWFFATEAMCQLTEYQAIPKWDRCGLFEALMRYAPKP